MAGPEITLGALYGMALREVEGEAAQALDPGTYQAIAEFVGGLRRQEYDNAEAGIKDAMVGMAEGLVSLLLRARLAKAAAGAADPAGLLGEERFIADAGAEAGRRRDAVLAAVLAGRSRLLESVARGHRTRLVTVRFLKDADEMVGADLEGYGPFGAEDIATVPYENAQALEARGAAVAVRWDV